MYQEYHLFGYTVTFTFNKIWKVGSISNPNIVANSDSFEIKKYMLFLEYVALQIDNLNKERN